MRTALVGTMILIGVLFAGCGDDESPESVIEAYIDAAMDGDDETMNGLVLDEELEIHRQFENPFRGLNDQGEDIDIRMGETHEKEDARHVHYEVWVDGEKRYYGVMVTVDHGGWKVSRERSTVHEPKGTAPPAGP